jgi:ABC-type multidrug transport system fused ATPase/permease subunit
VPFRLLSALFGATLIAVTISAAIRTFVLPRGADVWLTRWVFRWIHRLFWLRAARVHSYGERDHVMAMFAPTALLALPLAWVTLVLIGFTAVFWGAGVQPVYLAFRASGSSLLTLGFAPLQGWMQSVIAFSEATLGLGLIALVIAYLPAIYASFAKRETAVAMLEIRAGSPPSATTLLERAHRLDRLDQLGELWASWEYWFTEIEESHTSLTALVFFRSPQADRSWVTAAGALLDAAALAASAVDLPRDVRADLCIRSGYLALRRIADMFHIEYEDDPDPGDPISITRHEFDQALERLAAAGIPVRQDRDQSWRDFSGWRVNYDTVLIALAALTMAPYAPWVSDRSLRNSPVQTAIWSE